MKRNKILLIAGRKAINKYRTLQSAFTYRGKWMGVLAQICSLGLLRLPEQHPDTENRETGARGAEREPQISLGESGPAEPGQSGPALLICAFSNGKRAYSSCAQIYGF